MLLKPPLDTLFAKRLREEGFDVTEIKTILEVVDEVCPHCMDHTRVSCYCQADD